MKYIEAVRFLQAHVIWHIVERKHHGKQAICSNNSVWFFKTEKEVPPKAENSSPE